MNFAYEIYSYSTQPHIRHAYRANKKNVLSETRAMSFEIGRSIVELQRISYQQGEREWTLDERYMKNDHIHT